MIKGLTGGANVVVSNGGSSYPYVPTNINNPMQGMIRLYNQDFQVFDGSNWITLGGSYTSVDLSSDVQSIIQWARQEREKQLERERKMKDNPALRKAYEAVKRAEENFELIYKFVEHDDQSESNSVQASP